MWQIAHSDPVHPREISDSIPKNLATICLKAMVKEQEERYPTARAMANDIKRYLKGQKISVKHSFDPKKWVTENYQKLLIPIILVCAGLFFAFGHNETENNASNNSTDVVQSSDDTQNPSDKSHNVHNATQNDSPSKNDTDDNVAKEPRSLDQQKPHGDDRRRPIHDRFSSNNEDHRDDRRPPIRDRFSNNEDNRDDRRRPIRDRFSQGNRPTSDERMIGEHFRYCRECHDLIRKNRIDLGGPPPNWSRVPSKILKKIKKHAQNDK